MPWLYYIVSLFDNARFGHRNFVDGGIVDGSPMQRFKDVLLLWSMVLDSIWHLWPKTGLLHLSDTGAPHLFAARLGRWSWLGIASTCVVVAARVGHTASNCSDQSVPERIVEPRYLLARPSTHQSYSPDRMVQHIDDDPSEVIVFSEDQRWYEGFVVLQLREYLNGHVRGITADPTGIWE